MQTHVSVVGTIHYVRRVEEPLYSYDGMDPPPGRARTNHVLEPHEVEIRSIRDIPDGTDLDVQGFELVGFKTDIEDIYDAEQRAAKFDPAVAEFVKRRTGAVATR